jgi:hypothetical protein
LRGGGRRNTIYYVREKDIEKESYFNTKRDQVGRHLIERTLVRRRSCVRAFRYGDDSAWAVSTDVLKADVPPAKYVTMVTTMLPEALPSFVRMLEHWKGEGEMS